MHFSSAGGLLPASSIKKSAPYAVKRNVLTPGPWKTLMENWGLARAKNAGKKGGGGDKERPGQKPGSLKLGT